MCIVGCGISIDPEGKYEALDKYGNDLTELARRGKLDPVIGRDDEIRRCIQILSRRTKNNPVIIGEPGVGKTAIAEGYNSSSCCDIIAPLSFSLGFRCTVWKPAFYYNLIHRSLIRKLYYFCRLAQRIVRGDVPEPLMNRKVIQFPLTGFLFPFFRSVV